jgi:hypothetical protein
MRAQAATRTSLTLKSLRPEYAQPQLKDGSTQLNKLDRLPLWLMLG